MVAPVVTQGFRQFYCRLLFGLNQLGKAYGASIMRKFVAPSVVELSILATLAVLAATIVAGFGRPDVGIVVVAFPMVLCAMLMGAKRTGQLETVATPIVAPAAEAEQSA